MPTVRDQFQSLISRHIAAAVEEALAAWSASAGPGREVRLTTGTVKRRAPSTSTASGRPAAKAPGRRLRRSSTQIDIAIDRVLTFIVDHPAMTSEQIKKGMGSAKGVGAKVISDALARLRATKKIKTTGTKRSMTYSV